MASQIHSSILSVKYNQTEVLKKTVQISF